MRDRRSALGSPSPAHEPGTSKGEERPRSDGTEPGRQHTGTKGAGRPAAKASGRMSTGINPRNPIDPRMPYLQTP
jgi:hypothetical protein